MSLALLFSVCIPGALCTSYNSASVYAHSALAAEEGSEYSFDGYKNAFRRTYAHGGEEHVMREQLFNERVSQIRAHNAKGLSWHEGVNEFTDRTADEFQAYRGYRRHSMSGNSAPPSSGSSLFESSVDETPQSPPPTEPAATTPGYPGVLRAALPVLVTMSAFLTLLFMMVGVTSKAEKGNVNFRVVLVACAIAVLVFAGWFWLHVQHKHPVAVTPAVVSTPVAPPTSEGRVCKLDQPCSKGFTCGAKGVCEATAKSLPKSLDWSTRLKTGKIVLDQGACGSCWALAAAGVIMMQGEMNTNRTVEVSPQGMLGCTPNPLECGGQGACKGATFELALEWATQYGVQDLTSQKYTATDGCPASYLRGKAMLNIQGYVHIPENKPDLVMQALVTAGPLAISVAASPWMSYTGGVFMGCTGKEPVVDHAVVLVGYGTDPKGPMYWNIKNSWGPGWGEKGFIRLHRNYSPEGGEEPCAWDTEPDKGIACKDVKTGKYPARQWVCGECGLLTSTSYPVGTKLGSAAGAATSPAVLVDDNKAGRATEAAKGVMLMGQEVDNKWCKVLCQRFSMKALSEAFNGADFGTHPSGEHGCVDQCDKIVPAKA